mmetsp:Transcript_36662/g.88333  ORF Transcript_36662/g.88333 Transcript_36662/m.88333 type:complete len:292 (-) Transcript_36662:487-1362(-)
MDAEDAGSQCAIECGSDADCPGGGACFGGITTCSGEKYCGMDAEDAGSQCAIECSSDVDCPGGESCFGGITTCSGPTPSTPPAPGQSPSPTKAKGPPEPAQSPPPTQVKDPSAPSLPPANAGTTPPVCPEGCPDCDPNSPLQCPPRNLKRVCDKENDELYPPGTEKAGTRVANFVDCYDSCKPSFCCIHDSTSKELSPSCSPSTTTARTAQYDNCPLYYPCYIIWWKLHDTIGPATYMRVEQNEPFFEGLKFDYLERDFAEDEEFFGQLFNHHFEGDGPLTDDTFENQGNW